MKKCKLSNEFLRLLNYYNDMGLKLIEASEGCYHMFGMSDFPVIGIEIPEDEVFNIPSKKVIALMSQYFYNISDVFISYNTIPITEGVGFLDYHDILNRSETIKIYFTMPNVISSLITNKCIFKDFSRCYFDDMYNRSILFSQKIENINIQMLESSK